MVDYYIARTSHGSTLSGVVHTWVLARANRDRAMEFFEQVLKSDVADIQAGTHSQRHSPCRHQAASTLCNGGSPGWKSVAIV
jgi:trehalose/maltose hydrolase-like predicted phosphorylase